MFTDEVLDGVDIQSVWRKNNQLATETRGSQTREVRHAESGVQTRVSTTSQSSQTEEAAHHQYQQEDFLEGQQGALQGLQDFLHGVEDMVLRALVANVKSHAFDGFHVNWEERSHMVSCVHRLHHPSAQEKALHVTCVSWNSTGSVIACAYGRMDDGDWTSEKSCVCTWNLDRVDVHAERADLVIDVHSAVMALCFHPTLPNLITGGLYSGEVVVWDTSRTQDPLVAQTGMSTQSHREPVYQVVWVPCQGSRDLGVLSGSSGGRVLLWTLETDQRRLLLSEGYAFVREQVPHSSYAHAKAHGSAMVGVTSLAVSPWHSDTFVVGSEGGLLLKCSFSSQTPAAVPRCEPQEGAADPVTLRAPAVFCFRAPNHSPVHSIHWSPFHRNLFLSAGTDGLVHLHSVLQASPLLSVRVPDSSYVFQICWSPTRPLVFAAATGQGAVQVFDLGRRSIRPVASMDIGGVGGVATCLAFNHRAPGLLALGSTHGHLHVWMLSAELTEQQPNEMLRLEQLAAEVAE